MFIEQVDKAVFISWNIISIYNDFESVCIKKPKED